MKGVVLEYYSPTTPGNFFNYTLELEFHYREFNAGKTRLNLFNQRSFILWPSQLSLGKNTSPETSKVQKKTLIRINRCN